VDWGVLGIIVTIITLSGRRKERGKAKGGPTDDGGGAGSSDSSAAKKVVVQSSAEQELVAKAIVQDSEFMKERSKDKQSNHPTKEHQPKGPLYEVSKQPDSSSPSKSNSNTNQKHFFSSLIKSTFQWTTPAQADELATAGVATSQVTPEEAMKAGFPSDMYRPPMGWMAWERFRCEQDCDENPTSCISEELFRTTGDALVAKGLAKAG